MIAIALVGCGPWMFGDVVPPQLAMPIRDGRDGDPFAWRLDVSRVAPGGVGGMPAVGRVLDGDGDGVIDEGDPPNLAAACTSDGQVAVLDARRVQTVLVVAESVADPLIADVTGDGVAEVVVSSADGRGWRLGAYRGTGEVLWEARGAGAACTPVAADLEGDGAAEVVCGARVVDGRTGAVRVALDADPGGLAVLADLDVDGILEWIVGRTVRDPQGVVLGEAALADAPRVDLAVLDLDGDGDGEVVGASDAWIAAWEADGTVVWSLPGPGGAPCVGDTDGDGAPEIGVATGSAFTLLDADGEVRWALPYDLGDSSLSGCVVLDLDGDGRAELATVSAGRARIVDGDGRERWGVARDAVPGRLPVAADVDGDGRIELVVPDAGGGAAGVTVYAGAGWPEGPASWPSYDHGPSNIGEDGEIAAGAEAPWVAHGMFRAVP